MTNKKFSSPVVLFKSAVNFYRAHFQIIAYLLALPIFLSIFLEAIRLMSLGRATLIVVAISTVLVNIYSQVILIHLIDDDGKSTVQNYFERAWQIFWPFTWVVVLTGVISLAAFILLVIPGIIVAVFLAFSSFLAVTEGKRGTEALRTSWRYVRGYWWKVFGRLLFLIFTFIVASVVIYTISTPFAGLPFFHEIFSAIISGFVLSPIGVVYLFSLYQELKAAKSPLPDEL